METGMVMLKKRPNIAFVQLYKNQIKYLSLLELYHLLYAHNKVPEIKFNSDNLNYS